MSEKEPTKTLRGMKALKGLLEGRTPGRWKAAYWPIPEPYYWIGILPDDMMSSRMTGQVTGPIVSRTDAELIELAPELAEILLHISGMATKDVSTGRSVEQPLVEPIVVCVFCERDNEEHDEDCPIYKLEKLEVTL